MTFFHEIMVAEKNNFSSNALHNFAKGIIFIWSIIIIIVWSHDSFIIVRVLQGSTLGAAIPAIK